MSSNFQVIQTNPNTNGACICHREGAPGCKPPYAIFPGQELDGFPNAHVVASVGCLCEAAEACKQAGSTEVIDNPFITEPIKDMLRSGKRVLEGEPEPTIEDIKRRAALAASASEDAEPEPFRSGETGEPIDI